MWRYMEYTGIYQTESNCTNEIYMVEQLQVII